MKVFMLGTDDESGKSDTTKTRFDQQARLAKFWGKTNGAWAGDGGLGGGLGSSNPKDIV
jgi:hypothetical protein